MSEIPAISVVIPCYNTERYVGEAIESALDQTYSSVEVIVIDDGSTDGSLEVIRSFGARIRWETGPNRGACAARNRGLALARGELIQFLDADDLLHPEKLERMAPLASDPTTGMVYCDGVNVDPETGKHLRDHCYPLESSDPIIYHTLGAALSPCAPLHKIGYIKEVGGFHEGLPSSQDRDLHIRIACYGIPLTYLSEVLYTTRTLKTGISQTKVKCGDETLEIVRRAKEILRNKNRLTDARAEALAGMLSRVARSCIRSGYLRRACRYLREAKRLHPSRGLRFVYPGRARKIAPLIGMLPTELLVVIDEMCRALARRLMIKR